MKIATAFLTSLLVVLSSVGCAGNVVADGSVDEDPCNDDLDCLRTERCVEGVCQAVVFEAGDGDGDGDVTGDGDGDGDASGDGDGDGDVSGDGDGDGDVSGDGDGDGDVSGDGDGDGDGENLCGNGTIDAPEVCDDGLNDGSYGGCAADCSASGPSCGDGTINGPESCDDGVNDGNYNGCESDCLSVAAFCGDATVNGGEVCDNGANDGSYNGCVADCSAPGPYCGDAVVDSDDGEVCDDGVNDGSVNGCVSGCMEIGPFCGNGELDANEDCDDGNNTDDGNGCSESCQDNSVCGDGVVQSLFEACDALSACCRSDCSDKRPEDYVCRASSGECDVAETCGASSDDCPANVFRDIGDACGDDTIGACTNPDTCDGAGVCLDNHEPDYVLCGPGGNDGCLLDRCAEGACVAQFNYEGAECGDTSMGPCDAPDTCNTIGQCQPNETPEGGACAGCTSGDCGCSDVGVCLDRTGDAPPFIEGREISSGTSFPAANGTHNHGGPNATGDIGDYHGSEELRVLMVFNIAATSPALGWTLEFQIGIDQPTAGEFGYGVYLVKDTGTSVDYTDWNVPEVALVAELSTADNATGEVLSFDVTEAVNALVANGDTEIGVMVRPIELPQPNDQFEVTAFEIY